MWMSNRVWILFASCSQPYWRPCQALEPRHDVKEWRSCPTLTGRCFICVIRCALPRDLLRKPWAVAGRRGYFHELENIWLNAFAIKSFNYCHPAGCIALFMRLGSSSYHHSSRNTTSWSQLNENSWHTWQKKPNIHAIPLLRRRHYTLHSCHCSSRRGSILVTND